MWMNITTEKGANVNNKVRNQEKTHYRNQHIIV